tara:strand:+ start:305 stop:898 length:594 start_codon:yes stop_codon:yes gene_type:complete
MLSLLKNNSLSSRETKIVNSMLTWATKKDRLTNAQVRFFESIESNYSDEKIAKSREWISNFDDEKKEIMNIVAHYYYNQGKWFSSLAETILGDKNYIPSEKVYFKMCLNKYATRVLEETRKEPKYKVGQIVYAVKKANFEIRKLLDRGGVVLRSNAEPVTSAVKGGKRYLVLPVGYSHGIVIEERWLKSRRNSNVKK